MVILILPYRCRDLRRRRLARIIPASEGRGACEVCEALQNPFVVCSDVSDIRDSCVRNVVARLGILAEMWI